MPVLASALWGTTLVAAPAASATAFGTDCTTLNVGFFPTPITNACLGFIVEGKGVRADRQQASFDSIWKVCNWRIDFLYYNNAGRRYHTSYGPHHSGCSFKGVRGPLHNRTLQPGRVCAKLLKSGIETELKVCHYISA